MHMPAQTTATLMFGPVLRMMGGHGTMRAQTMLVLDEGSRASWRVVELDEPGATVCAVADAPRDLLTHGLLAFLASRSGDPFGLADNPDQGALALRSRDGDRIQTHTGPSTPQALAQALGGDVAIVATILPGSTLTTGEVEALAALGVQIGLAA
jgi:hypothetical protein